jgi:nitronate monooxygenase
MEGVSGGLLAHEVSSAGGLGLIAGSYGDYEWLAHEWANAAGERVGIGFISWALSRQPATLRRALDELDPVAVMLSFGDPAPFAGAVLSSGAILMIQVQTIADTQRALDVGADVIVAQGTEAGGHGTTNRATMPLIPAIVDLVAERNKNTPVVASGGIADGRGIAAALALGADGVLMGTRFWATAEALVPAQGWSAMLAATGEETVRTHVEDFARGRDWPHQYTSRVLRNRFVDHWQDASFDASADLQILRHDYEKALVNHDYDVVPISSSQSAGLIRRVEPAADLVTTVISEAEATLTRLYRGVCSER